MKVDLVPLVVGLIGAGGLGAFFREIVAGVTKILGGMSARESKRKVDIVQQRDAAVALAESEGEQKRMWRERYYVLRIQLINMGASPGALPEGLEDTVTKAQLKELRDN